MSSKPADDKPADTTTRETGETPAGQTTERATVADSAAEQRDAEPEAPTDIKTHANGSLFGPPEDGVATADQQLQATIDALLREKAGYDAHDKPDRAKAVAAELKRLGHKAG